MTTSRVSPKARRTRGLAVTLLTVRDPGSLASTAWRPFQLRVTGTRWTTPFDDADASHALVLTASNFVRASALRSARDRAAMATRITSLRSGCEVAHGRVGVHFCSSAVAIRVCRPR